MTHFNSEIPVHASPSVREAAEALLARWPTDQHDGSPLVDEARALRAALDAPEPSRPGVLPSVDHALGAIAAMKRGEPIMPEDIKAIVELAEHGAEQLREFGIRWEADMRAIQRWQKGDLFSANTRKLLGDLLTDLPPSAARHELEERLKVGEPNARDLILPDHADLVVWLLQVMDVEPEGPSVEQVFTLQSRLKAAHNRVPTPLLEDAIKLINQFADALRKVSRRAFMAEQRPEQPATPGESLFVEHVAALALLVEAVEEIRAAASTYADQNIGDGYRDASALAARIDAFITSAA